MKEPYDIAIVGAGLVGSSLALMLAEQGSRVLLIEAKAQNFSPPETQPGRALVLTEISRRILMNLGVLNSVLAEARAIDQIHLSQQGSIASAYLSAAELDLADFGILVQQPTLQRALAKQVQQHVNIDLLLPAELIGLEQTEQQVIARIQTAGEEKTIHAHLMLAADGVDSEVRRLLQIVVSAHAYQQTALIMRIETQPAAKQCAYERFLKTAGVIAALPQHDGRFALVWSHATQHMQVIAEKSDAELLQLLQQIFGTRLGEFKAISSRFSFPLTSRWVEQPVAGRVLLMGNAAHQLHPIAAQGFNLSLRDGAVFADHLAQAKEAGKTALDAGLLQSYQQRRANDVQRTQFFTHILAEYSDRSHFLFRQLRGAAILGLAYNPLMRRYLSRWGVGFLRGYIPRLALKEH